MIESKLPAGKKVKPRERNAAYGSCRGMIAPVISGRCPVGESYSGGIGSVGTLERESGTAVQAVIFYTQAGCLCHEHAREIVSFSVTVATVTVNSSAPFPSVILNPPQADEGPHIGCLITPFDLACPLKLRR